MVQGADYLRGLGYSEAQIASLRPNTVVEFHPEKGGYTIREPNRYQPEIPEWLKVQGSGNDLLVQPAGFVSGWSQAPTVSPAEMQTFISSGGAGVEAERTAASVARGQERLAFAEPETITREIPTSFGAAGTTTTVQVPTKQTFVSPFKQPIPFKEQIRRSLQDYGGGAYSQGFQYTYPETLGSQRRYAAGADLTPVFDKKQLAEAAINKMSAYEFQQMKEKQAQIATEQKAFKKEYAPLAKEWAALEKKYPGKELPEELYVPYMREFTKLQAETKAVEQKFLGIEAKRLSYQGKYYSELEAFKTFGEAGVPITPKKSTETFKTGSLIVPGSPWAQPPFAEKGFDLKKIASSKFKEWKGWDLGKQEKQTVIGSNFDVRTMFSKENWNKQNTGVTIPGGLKSTRNIDVKKAFNLEEMGWVKYESPLGFEWSGERIEAASAGQKGLAAATGVGMMFVLPAASAYTAGSLSGLATYGVQTGAFLGAAAVLPQFNEEALKAFAPGREEWVYDIGADILALTEAYVVSKGATAAYTKFVKPRFEKMLFGAHPLELEYTGPFTLVEEKGKAALFKISGSEITKISKLAKNPKLAAKWFKLSTRPVDYSITEKIGEEIPRLADEIKPSRISYIEVSVPKMGAEYKALFTSDVMKKFGGEEISFHLTKAGTFSKAIKIPTTSITTVTDIDKVIAPWYKTQQVAGEYFTTTDLFAPAKKTGLTFFQLGRPMESGIKYQTFIGGLEGGGYKGTSWAKYTASIKGELAKATKGMSKFTDYSGQVRINITTQFGTPIEQGYGFAAMGKGQIESAQFFYKGISPVVSIKPGSEIGYILKMEKPTFLTKIKAPSNITHTPFSKTFGSAMEISETTKGLNEIGREIEQNLKTVQFESEKMNEILKGAMTTLSQKIVLVPPTAVTRITSAGYVSGASAAVASYFQIGATTKPKGKLSAPSQITVPAFSISQIEKQLQKQNVIPQIGITTAPATAEEVIVHQQQREAERLTISEIIGEIATEITAPIEIITPGEKITPVQGITPGTIERITERIKIEDLDIVDLFNMPPPIPPAKQPPTFIPTMKFGGFKMPKMPKQGKGYNVFAKVSGKFQKLNKMPLIKEYAMGLGAKFVEETTAATFKITPTPFKGMRMIGISKFRPERFRAPKRRGFQMPSIGTFIEKSKYRIDMPKEFAGITYKGLAALKAKRSNIMLIGLPSRANHKNKKKRKRR